ncbi:BCL-6 corepressor-like protein 1 isoform X2 [Brachyhypopomus gauderio]
MQVDPSPMNVGDGGAVSRESGAPAHASVSMVGNPQQTLPPELRGDVPPSQQSKLRTSTDYKAPGVCSEASKASNSNHCPEVPPSHPRNNAPVFSTDPLSTPLPDRTEVPKAKADGAGVYPTHHWPCGKKVAAEEPVNSVHGGATSNKKSPHSPGHAQSVIGLPPGFQCSTLFKPGQPVAFLPSPNFSSPLCKITLPPALGQIAALREATASQFQKECPAPGPGSSMTPRLKTYPYQFSVGRGLTTDKKPLSSASKGRSDSVSNAKGCKGVGEHKSAISSAVSPAIQLPVQQATQGSAPLTRYTISPTAAICCSSALAKITTPKRLLSLVEKCPPFRGVEKTPVAYLKPKTSSSTEEHNAPCPPETRDVPLDLSSKSKRPKCAKDTRNSPTVAAEHHPVELRQKNVHAAKKAQTTLGTATTYALLPDTQRNGASQRSSSKIINHNSLEPAASWSKGSSPAPLNNLPGTYVGVASPILASTLRSKDGKNAAFVEDIQTFAKQETISIIDQGEQLPSRGKKANFSVKGGQQNKGIKHPLTTTSPGVLELPSTPLFVGASSQSPRKTLGGKAGIPYTPPVIKSLWQQPSIISQGMSVQKRSSQSQAPSKVKGNMSCETPLFHSSDLSLTKLDEEKWAKTKSPLSNLESIVKQKVLETTALTGENYSNLSAVGQRNPEVASMLNRCPDSPPQQKMTSTTFTPSRLSEAQDHEMDRASSPTDVTTTVARPEPAVEGPKEKSREKQTKPSEHVTGAGGQRSKPSSLKKRCASSALKSGRKESKLTQELAEDTREKPGSRTQLPSRSKLEGITLSIHPAQTEAEGEKKASDAKEFMPSTGKVAGPVSKQKKPRKPAKERAPPEMPKTTGLLLKMQEKESVTVMQGSTSKKKKDVSSIVEKSLLKDSTCPSPETMGKIHKGKSSLVKMEQPTPNKTSCESGTVASAQVEENPSILGTSTRPCKEAEAREDPSPRLRRGRRRTDEALLRDWSFASPPTPPPPPPPALDPPFSSVPAGAPSAAPPRRPRGRPRLNPLPGAGDADKARASQKSEAGDTASMKKRKRCRNRRYQNGEYITEKEKAVDGQKKERPGGGEDQGSDEKTALFPRLSATLTCGVPGPDLSPRRSLYTRSGTVRRQESPPTQEFNDKPPGKRKFKSKHLCDAEEQKKLKTKRGLLGKRSSTQSTDDDSPAAKKPFAPYATPKGPSSPSPRKKGPGRGTTPDSTPSRPVPPEVRRLIVNKNAGETLLQRAARLGYQEVVLYCLEKDIREVNRRDNAGYTALHEACARGWTHIVQLLLKHGADVNCSAQDGTRPIHDAVAADNLAAVWMLLNHGADPTLATYSGQTAVKLAQSASMKAFLKEYFTDLEGRTDQDPGVQWDFYSSSVFETDQEACWDFLLSLPEDEDGEDWREQGKERDSDTDCLLFEFSSEPLLPCYHVQVSLTQGYCNWFLLTDVLRRMKVSARIFRARYPQFEVVSIVRAELWRQMSVSQTCVAPEDLQPTEGEEGDEELVELVRCVPELQGLLGSSIQLLREDEDERSEVTARLCSSR